MKAARPNQRSKGYAIMTARNAARAVEDRRQQPRPVRIVEHGRRDVTFLQLLT
jgi:hypothetical protein